MLIRAAQYGISSKLLALLSGLGGNGAGLGSVPKNNKDLIDAEEEKLLQEKDKEAKAKDKESWD